MYKRQGKDKPVISGAITLTSWEKTPEGWWKTHVDEVARYGLKIEQLYVNGNKMCIRDRIYGLLSLIKEKKNNKQSNLS